MSSAVFVSLDQFNMVHNDFIRFLRALTIIPNTSRLAVANY